MRFVKRKDLKPGMVSGLDIVDLAGNVVLKTNDVLVEYNVDELNQMGYAGIYVEDEISENIIIDNRFSGNYYKFTRDIVAEKNVEELCKIAIMIVDDILNNQPQRVCIQNVFSFDDALFYHCIDTTIYSTIIGEELGLDREGLYYLAQAAILHDIGLVGVSKELLQNDGILSLVEKKILKSHVQKSVEIAKAYDMNELILDAIACHHENENGTGYPNGLSSDDIPDFAKIIHVADVLDEMTTQKRHKDPYLPADVFDYLSSGVGFLFHEAVVEAAIKRFDAYPIGAEVTLSDERKAVIWGRTEDNMRPQIILTETNEKVSLLDHPDYKYVAIKSSLSLLPKEQEEQKPLIVVVDDVYICRRVVEEALHNEFEVVCFESGAKAIDFIMHNPVSLVIMDIEMPEMDGITAVKILRKGGLTELPVIYLTSVNDKKKVVECVNTGAIDYVLKPIKQIYVYERVKEAIKNME